MLSMVRNRGTTSLPESRYYVESVLGETKTGVAGGGVAGGGVAGGGVAVFQSHDACSSNTASRDNDGAVRDGVVEASGL